MELHNRNRQIRAQTLLVIDENGEKLGEMETQKAIELAETKELDLIEVSPNDNPPVAKIMSWSKYRYEQDKKKKESKGRSVEMKEMWFKVFISQADLEHKLNKVEDFIKKKHSVQLLIIVKGRVRNEQITDLMKRILTRLEETAEPQSPPKFQGRNMGVILIPRKTKLIKEENEPTKPEKQETTTQTNDTVKKLVS